MWERPVTIVLYSSDSSHHRLSYTLKTQGQGELFEHRICVVCLFLSGQWKLLCVVCGVNCICKGTYTNSWDCRGEQSICFLKYTLIYSGLQLSLWQLRISSAWFTLVLLKKKLLVFNLCKKEGIIQKGSQFFSTWCHMRKYNHSHHGYESITSQHGIVKNLDFKEDK